jgi:3-hydroxyacyl-CoA dehydrogenase/3a,7a,12a-trihydroxy-5b-cholest-24-enoyl-CoA hydratase
VLPFKGSSQDVVPFPPPSMMIIPDGMPVVNPAMILHGEQSLEIFEPLNPNGSELICKSKVISFFDKGKGTLMETETIIQNSKGKKIARLITGSFLRGLYGYKGSQGRKLPPRVEIPKDRAPDICEIYPINLFQAQIYRLSGDYNALHIDPMLAQSVGLSRPILHGLCTLGIASRALYKHFCHGKPKNFQTIRARFSKPCFPGDLLEICMWKISFCQVFFQVRKLKEKKDNTKIIIIDNGEFIFNQTSTTLSPTTTTTTTLPSSHL